jgi:chromosome partitioning protein
MFITWANEKGGVGKSTLAAHNAVWIADQGFKTALLDADKQYSSSEWISQGHPNITIVRVDDAIKCLPIGSDLAASHDFVIGDAPAGTGEMTRTLLILADRAFFPVKPSLLDVRSLGQAVEVLRYARKANRDGRPDARIVLNEIEPGTILSRELREAVSHFGIEIAANEIHDREIYKEAVKYHTVVSGMGRKGAVAAADMDALFMELFADEINRLIKSGKQAVANG